MDTKINKVLINDWATQIFNYNEEAINTLNELKVSVSSIINSYNCDSSEGLITSMNSDIDNAIKNHTNMESLQDFLQKIIENAENA